MGWCNVHSDGTNGLWLWLEDYGWLWTQEGVWPYLYSHNNEDWIYFLGNKNGQPIFHILSKIVVDAKKVIKTFEKSPLGINFDFLSDDDANRPWVAEPWLRQ